MSDRFIPPDELPPSLWNPDYTAKSGRNGCLVVPAMLGAAYREILTRHGLMALASDLTQRHTGETGGEGKIGAERYLATRFSSSCGRIQLYALDPHFRFQTSTDALLSLFSGGRIRLLDIPSGAGAGSAILLSVFAELRATDKLPRTDLKVHVVGGEKNLFQHDFANELFEFLKPWWLDHGIEVSWEFCEWDVLSNENTIDLIDKWRLPNEDWDRFAVLGANFSDFLSTNVPGANNLYLDEALPSLSNIFSTAGVRKASAFWIEPKANKGNKVLNNLQKTVFDKVKRLENNPKGINSSEGDTLDPIVDENDFAVTGIAVHLKPVQ